MAAFRLNAINIYKLSKQLPEGNYQCLSDINFNICLNYYFLTFGEFPEYLVPTSLDISQLLLLP